jgi:hypothetical protein
MILQVPRDGLHELFRNWSGDGDLCSALAASSGTEEIDWNATDVRLRAQRVLLGRLEPLLHELPASLAQWQEVIPVTSEAEDLVSTAPRGRVNWAATVRRFGWPPTAFEHRRRYRVQDETALTTLAWMAGRLAEFLGAANQGAPNLAARVASPIECMTAAAAILLGDTAPSQPDRSDLLSLQSSGRPWSLVAAIAAQILRLQSDLEFLAFELLEPDPEAASRLFHLSVFGKVVTVLRGHGYTLRWRSPIGGSRSGPRLLALSPEGRTFDLWFEAGGMRSYYRLGGGAYPAVVTSIRAAAGEANSKKVGRPVGADVALIESGCRALLLECKWSESPTYVGRNGFHQAASYALDARNDLVKLVWSFIVGPAEVIPSKNISTDLAGEWGITLGSLAVPDLDWLVSDFLTLTA